MMVETMPITGTRITMNPRKNTISYSGNAGTSKNERVASAPVSRRLLPMSLERAAGSLILPSL
jgi:hypothetical protein